MKDTKQHADKARERTVTHITKCNNRHLLDYLDVSVVCVSLREETTDERGEWSLSLSVPLCGCKR